MIIEIDNLRPDQEKVIEGFLRNLQDMGHIGHSAWVALYADGDGTFRPKIEINGENAENIPLGDWLYSKKFLSWRGASHKIKDMEPFEFNIEVGVRSDALFGKFYVVGQSDGKGNPVRKYDIYDEKNKLKEEK